MVTPMNARFEPRDEGVEGYSLDERVKFIRAACALANRMPISHAAIAPRGRIPIVESCGRRSRDALHVRSKLLARMLPGLGSSSGQCM